MIDTAVILAGGMGLRLRPLTEHIPKPLLPIKGKPILEWIIDAIREKGVKKVILSTGYKSECIKNYFRDGKSFGVQISYPPESEELGTGGAVKLAAQGLREPFFLLWGDNLMNLDLDQMYREYLQKKTPIIMALTRREDVENFGVAQLVNGKIAAFVEKPAREAAPSNWINAGAFIIHPQCLQILPEKKSSIEKDCFEKLASLGKISAFLHEGQWFPTDTLEKYYFAERYFQPGGKNKAPEDKSSQPHYQPPNRSILTNAKFKSWEWANEPVISEALFREYDLREPIVNLTKSGKEVKAGINEEGFKVLGQAYGTYVQQRMKQRKIIVSNDYRSYSRGLAYAFITGVLSTGVDVIDLGVTLTPVLYFSQYLFNLEGGAMITASHNDNGWAGVKLAKGFSQTFEPEDISEFKRLVYSQEFLQGKGSYEQYSGIKSSYFQEILNKYRPLLGKRKLRVVVNTANGGAGEFLPALLEELGLEVIKVDCELDWSFPKFNPNPENIRFLEELGEAVRENQADLGVGADGDGDRFGVVDEKGKEIFSDRAGLFIARYLSEKVPNKPIVIDVKSTGAYLLDPILQKNGMTVAFSKTGHSYVKALAHKLDALAGLEKSGHFFFRQDFGRGYDDACLSAALFCVVLSNHPEPLSQLIAEQPRSYQSPTMSPSVTDDKAKYEIVDSLTKEFEEMKAREEPFAGQKIKEVITINGARVILEDGSWGLVRASSNQPTLVVVAESFSTKKQLYGLFEEIQHHLERHGIKKEHYDQLLPPYSGEEQ